MQSRHTMGVSPSASVAFAAISDCLVEFWQIIGPQISASSVVPMQGTVPTLAPVSSAHEIVTALTFLARTKATTFDTVTMFASHFSASRAIMMINPSNATRASATRTQLFLSHAILLRPSFWPTLRPATEPRWPRPRRLRMHGARRASERRGRAQRGRRRAYSGKRVAWTGLGWV